jgi:hypothetical protein
MTKNKIKLGSTTSDNRPKPDPIVLDWYISHLILRWADESGPDLVSVISDSCGWLPLELGESMRVHFGDKAYEIKRTE